MAVIARAYESESKAQEVTRLLVEKGMTSEQIQTVTPQPNAGSAAAGLRAGRALSQYRDIEAYATALDKGQTIVLADAHFGSGAMISKLMDECGPATLETVADLDDAQSRSSPFSFSIGLPVLSRNNPTPFSNMFGFSTKTGQKSSFGARLSEHSTSLSSLFGLPLLTRNDGSFFSKFGFKDLSNESMGDSKMGMSLLSKNATPLSSKIGMSCKSDNPAPFSSLLKLPLLSRRPDNNQRQQSED